MHKIAAFIALDMVRFIDVLLCTGVNEIMRFNNTLAAPFYVMNKKNPLP